MKTIYIVRHAKSSWKTPAISDFQRPLKSIGIQSAIYKAQRLRERSVKPDFMISSPAIRAVNTAILFAEQLNYPFRKLVLDKKLYAADVGSLMEVIRETEERYSSLMLFGHNNGLSELVEQLDGSFRDTMPTAGVVCLELDITDWNSAEEECGKIVFDDFGNLPDEED